MEPRNKSANRITEVSSSSKPKGTIISLTFKDGIFAQTEMEEIFAQTNDTPQQNIGNTFEDMITPLIET